MMEFIVVIVGNYGIVEKSNPVVITRSTETGFVLVDDMDVNVIGVDFKKMRQR